MHVQGRDRPFVPWKLMELGRPGLCGLQSEDSTMRMQVDKAYSCHSTQSTPDDGWLSGFETVKVWDIVAQKQHRRVRKDGVWNRVSRRGSSDMNLIEI